MQPPRENYLIHYKIAVYAYIWLEDYQEQDINAYNLKLIL